MKTVTTLFFLVIASIAARPGGAGDGRERPKEVVFPFDHREAFVDGTPSPGLGEASQERAPENASGDTRAPANVGDASKASDEKDRQIACQVEERLRRYVFYTIWDDVRVTVENGVVKLDGRVTWPLKAAQIAEMAASAPGVVAVRNDIEVSPDSYDRTRSRMRSEVAARIYTDKRLRSYAFREDPIRVIVEGSSVILRGVVRSGEDKRRAERVARSVFGVLWVVNDLRVEPIEADSTGGSCR